MASTELLYNIKTGKSRMVNPNCVIKSEFDLITHTTDFYL